MQTTVCILPNKKTQKTKNQIPNWFWNMILVLFLKWIQSEANEVTHQRGSSGLFHFLLYLPKKQGAVLGVSSLYKSPAHMCQELCCVTSPLCGTPELAQFYACTTAPPPLNSVGLMITAPSLLSFLWDRNNLILLASRMREWEAGGCMCIVEEHF